MGVVCGWGGGGGGGGGAGESPDRVESPTYGSLSTGYLLGPARPLGEDWMGRLVASPELQRPVDCGRFVHALGQRYRANLRTAPGAKWTLELRSSSAAGQIASIPERVR